MRRLLVFLLAACTAEPQPAPPSADYVSAQPCGPETAFVEHVIDGDTVRLDTDETVRYLLVDTPETTKGKLECYGVEARTYNEELVLGEEVRLYYDVECRDRYDRLLVYVEVPDGLVNELLVARGFAEVLHIPPNGADHVDDYLRLERVARDGRLGQWGACP